jgi:hypothetical protein
MESREGLPKLVKSYSGFEFSRLLEIQEEATLRR